MGKGEKLNPILRFLKDESGQSTTEYVLILAVVVMIAMQFRTVFKGTMSSLLGKLKTNLDSAVDE